MPDLEHDSAPVSNECATEGCANAGTERFEAGGVGSSYCPDCHAKIIALRSYDKQALEGAAEFFEQIATMGNPAPLAFAQAIRRALRSQSPEPSSSEVVAPKGWKLVPEEPSDKMMIAGGFSFAGRVPNKQVFPEVHKVWDAMLAATPTLSPTVSQPGTGEEVEFWKARADEFENLNAELSARLSAVEGALKTLGTCDLSDLPGDVVTLVREALTTITGGGNEVVWCESCGEAEQAHRTQYAGLCSDCWHAQGQPK